MRRWQTLLGLAILLSMSAHAQGAVSCATARWAASQYSEAQLKAMAAAVGMTAEEQKRIGDRCFPKNKKEKR